jgi:hypothetical protein
VILYPPQKFDLNEWIILIFIIINVVIFYLLPKKFPASITILILLFGIFQSKTADFILDKLFELYYANDLKKYEWFDILLIGVYPFFSYYYIYIYEIWKFKGISLFIYIFLFGLFSVGYEFLFRQVHVFNFTGWNSLYSFPVYLISLSFTLLSFRLIIVIKERIHQQIRDLS